MGGNMAITDVNAYIKNMFDPQTAAVNAAYDATAADLNTKISNAGSVYQPSKNDAYTTALQQQRLYNENMANMGYSGAGQMSQTLQQRASNNLQSTLGTINTSQQEYINGIASDLRNAGVTRDTALAGVAADQGSAQLDAYNTEQTRALQLYSAGIISAAQFQQMTGISPVVRGSGTGGGGGDINTYIQGQLANQAATINSQGGDAGSTRNLALSADTTNFTGIKNGVYWYRGQIVSKDAYLRARSSASQH